MALLQNAAALHKKWSSLAPHQVMLFNQSSGTGYTRCIPSVVRARAEGETVSLAKQGIAGRREILAGVGAFTASVFSTDIALAEQAPKGYQTVLDKFDGYSFIYPFGWQEVVVKGQDKVYKDVIEPLESVSINIVPTDKKDIHDLGSPEEVAGTLVRRVLSSPSQKTELLNVKEENFTHLQSGQMNGAGVKCKINCALLQIPLHYPISEITPFGQSHHCYACGALLRAFPVMKDCQREVCELPGDALSRASCKQADRDSNLPDATIVSSSNYSLLAYGKSQFFEFLFLFWSTMYYSNGLDMHFSNHVITNLFKP